MQLKKSNKANLEKRRAIHIQLGLIIALSFVLVSLEWGMREATTEEGSFYIPTIDIEEDIIQATLREKPKEPPKIPKLLIIIQVDEGDEDENIDLEGLFDSEDNGEGIDWKFTVDEPEDRVPEPIDRALVEFQPEFPGGEKAMMKWLYNNIKYPEECVEHGIEGIVTAKFTISKFGQVTDVRIYRSVHPLLDAEVIRVLELMPDFRPAMQGTQLVPVFMLIPVAYDIRY